MKTFLLIFLMHSLGGSAFATTLLMKSFQDLVLDAEGIVEGTIGTTESIYDQQFRIYTFVTLEDLNVLSGSYGEDSLVLRFTGGKVGNEVQWIEGSPQLQTGDRVILFLRANGEALVPIVGWTQGVFRIITDSQTLEQTIHDHGGNRIFSIKGNNVIKEHRVQPDVLLVDPQSGLFLPKSESTKGKPPLGVGQEGMTSSDRNGQPSKEVAPTIEKALSKGDFVQAILQRRSKKPTPLPSLQSVDVLSFRQQAPTTAPPQSQLLPNSQNVGGVLPKRYPRAPHSGEKEK